MSIIYHDIIVFMKTEVETKTISQLLLRVDDIDLDPDFQREKVWGLKKQQMLIDTIIKNWGIPKIYLTKEEGDDGIEKFQCIDGKQRLASIFSFVTNGFKLSPEISTEYGNLFYKELPTKVRDVINDFSVTIESISDSSNEDLAEFFKRLQLATPLNSAEKLWATPGKMNGFAKEIATHSFFMKKVTISNRRYSHFAVAAQVCLTGIQGASSAKYGSLEKFFETYSGFNPNGLDAQKVREILDFLSGAFPDSCAQLGNRANIISIFLLIYDLQKKGEIAGREADLGNFFRSFIQELKKVIASKEEATPEKIKYLEYQNAVIQAADSITSINTRSRILQESLIHYDPFYENILNLMTPRKRFESLYEPLETLHGGKPSAFDTWLKKNTDVEVIACDGAKDNESLPVHVRNSFHHSKHPKCTKEDISYSIEFLSKLK